MLRNPLTDANMSGFFLAIPDSGASYLFGLCPDAAAIPDAAARHLGGFRQRNVDARVRLLMFSDARKCGKADDLLSAAVAHVYRRMAATHGGAQMTSDKGLYECAGDTDEGVVAMEGLVRAFAVGNVQQSEFPPLREERRAAERMAAERMAAERMAAERRAAERMAAREETRSAAIAADKAEARRAAVAAAARNDDRFFLAIPDTGTDYLFGTCPGSPDAASAATERLARYRRINPEATVRLLVTGNLFVQDCQEAAMRHVERRQLLKWSTLGNVERGCDGIYVCTGDSEEGVVAMEGLIRAIVFGHVAEYVLASHAHLGVGTGERASLEDREPSLPHWVSGMGMSNRPAKSSGCC